MWPGALTAFLLAAAGWPLQRALGDARGSRRVGEAILLGLSAGALVLYALSLAGLGWSRGGLALGVAVLVAVGLVASRRRSLAVVEPDDCADGRERTIARLADGTLVVVAAVYAVYAAAVTTVHWDYWAIWGLKARVFFAAGGVDWAFLGDRWNAFAHPEYPPLLPLAYDAAAVVAGRWDERDAIPIFLAFAFAGLLVVRGHLLAATDSPVLASVGALATTGILLSPWAGIADVPLMALSIAGLLAVRRGLETQDGRELTGGAVFLGLAALTKNEGLSLLAASAIGVAAASVAAVGGARRWTAVARLWPAVALAATWQIPSRVFGFRSDLVAAEPLDMVLARLREAGRLAAILVASTPAASLVLAGLVAVALAIAGRAFLAREAFLLTTVAAQLAAYLLVYLETANPAEWQIANSWPRIHQHLLLPLVVVAVAGLARSLRERSQRPATGTTLPSREKSDALHCLTMQSEVVMAAEQLTVRLPEELGRALRSAATRSHRKSSEIVRLALREYLGLASAGAGAERPADRVRDLIGSLESGIPDLATRSRDYLVEAIRRGG